MEDRVWRDEGGRLHVLFRRCMNCIEGVHSRVRSVCPAEPGFGGRGQRLHASTPYGYGSSPSCRAHVERGARGHDGSRPRRAFLHCVGSRDEKRELLEGVLHVKQAAEMKQPPSRPRDIRMFGVVPSGAEASPTIGADQGRTQYAWCYVMRANDGAAQAPGCPSGFLGPRDMGNSSSAPKNSESLKGYRRSRRRTNTWRHSNGGDQFRQQTSATLRKSDEIIAPHRLRACARRSARRQPTEFTSARSTRWCAAATRGLRRR